MTNSDPAPAAGRLSEERLKEIADWCARDFHAITALDVRALLNEIKELRALLIAREAEIAYVLPFAKISFELAHEDAFRMEDDYDETDIADGHTRVFESCQHPDCVRAKSAASPDQEP